MARNTAFALLLLGSLCIAGCGGSSSNGGSGSGSGGSGGGGGTQKTTPTISAWPTASTITYGQTLASSTLTGGTASVPGTFAWTTPSTVLAVGTDPEGVTFTPTDSTDYNMVTGSVTVTVDSLPTPTTPVIVPSILLAGQQSQVTVTCFVSGADSSTQVQLFNLASGTPVLVGSMSDNGENGDQTAGDQVYTVVTNLTPPMASSLPLQVVATTGANKAQSANLSVQLVQIPTFTTNTDVNQAEFSIYSTAIQTRSSLAAPVWSNPSMGQNLTSNLLAMFAQLSGVINQNSALQTSSISANTIRTRGVRSDAASPDGILGDILNVISLGIYQPAQNNQACQQLLDSLSGFPPPSPYPVLSPNDPQMKTFADDLVAACASTAGNCGGLNLTEDDFLRNTADSYIAYQWAAGYIGGFSSLPTPIAGCSGGVTQSLNQVAVDDGVGTFTDLAGQGVGEELGDGAISQELVGDAASQGFDLITGSVVDSSGHGTVVIGNVGANQTITAPSGTYNATVSFGGDNANATITNTPVYPNSITNISPLPGIILFVSPPDITQLNPSAGVPGAPVSINGTGFDPNPAGNVVTFNGITAQVLSSTELSIQTEVPDGASSGPVSVTNASGSTVSSTTFTVNGASGNPVPTINTLLPASLAVGATPQTLTINGTGFLASSTVTFNDITHTPTYVSASQLAISLTSADLATAGTYPVVVTNPAPGGGLSGPADFTVTNGQSVGEWTWMTGNNAFSEGQYGDLPGVFGTLGVPSAANTPPGKSGAVSWLGSNGGLWLFGGWWYEASGTVNDLWQFDPTSGMWTWMSGSEGLLGLGLGATTVPGVYGTEGVPAAGNVPGGREGAVSWADSNGNLWLFGGEAYTGSQSFFNDLWEFNPTTNLWTWMNGSNTYDAFGVYGTQDVPASSNVPGSRSGAVSWTDSSGNFWLFGGSGYLSPGAGQTFNDLWEFNPTTSLWTWVSGSSTSNQLGVYGTQGIPAATNVPGARSGSVSWVDSGGNFWLFGGIGVTPTSAGNYLNDLWEFNPTSKIWTWVSGSNTAIQPGVYGTQGVPAATNVPGARTGSVGWTDGSGNLWLFGGAGYVANVNNGIFNDLWEFDPSTNLWTWVDGSNTLPASGGLPGVYGTEGVPAVGNIPGARANAVGWIDSSGNLWLFGGGGYDSDGVGGELNDLWRYQP